MTLIVSKLLYLAVSAYLFLISVRGALWNEGKEIQRRERMIAVGFSTYLRINSIISVVLSLSVIFLSSYFQLSYLWYLVAAIPMSSGIAGFIISFTKKAKERQEKLKDRTVATDIPGRIKQRRISSTITFVILFAWAYSGHEHVI